MAVAGAGGCKAPPPPSFREALWVWIRVAAQSFGGPAGQIAVMHRILVEEKRWLSEKRFLHALNYCMVLPGPEAMQLATYSGWLLHGVRGGLVAGALFVLPGFLAILVLSILYALYQQVGAVEALFYGLQAAVLAIVVHAVFRIGGRALRRGALVLLALASFAALFLFAVPFPAVIAGAALLGLLGARMMPHRFSVPDADGSEKDRGGSHVGDAMAKTRMPSLWRTMGTAATWLAVWILPLALLALMLGPTHTITQQGWFFSKVAVVSFGGAYAVLSYVAQHAVEGYGWLEPAEMLDGLGMAEGTPGPLIQVLQFVGFMGAYRAPDGMTPMAAALLASLVATWATFVPCFLWIFTGAPYIEALRNVRWLTDAMRGVTAGVVGAILNLAVFFSLHVLFSDVGQEQILSLRILVPVWRTLDPVALGLMGAALLALFRFRVPMLWVLGAAAGAGMLLHAIG